MSEFNYGYDEAVSDIKTGWFEPTLSESGEIVTVFADTFVTVKSNLEASADYSDSFIEGYLDACLDYINEKNQI